MLRCYICDNVGAKFKYEKHDTRWICELCLKESKMDEDEEEDVPFVDNFDDVFVIEEDFDEDTQVPPPVPEVSE